MRGAMKWTLSTLLALTASAAVLVGQTPVKTRPATSHQPSLLTDQEKNIRAYVELLRIDIRKDRSQLVDTVMQLDAEDATTFWPIYNEFITEYVQLGDNILALIKSYAATYATLTNQAADNLTTRLLDLEEAVTAEGVSTIGRSKTRSVQSRRPDSFRPRANSIELSTCKSTRNSPRLRAYEEATHEGSMVLTSILTSAGGVPTVQNGSGGTGAEVW
jgi:hypothetical protein